MPMAGAASGDEAARAAWTAARRHARTALDAARRASRSSCRSIVPLIAFAVLALTFSNAVIRNLRVTIVDADRSATSLTYVQAIGSAPGVSVAERSGDMTSAMRAIRSGEAIAAVYIPEDFERDLLAGHRPADRDALQQAIFHARQQRQFARISNAIAAATATLPRAGDGGGYRPGAARCRAICADRTRL